MIMGLASYKHMRGESMKKSIKKIAKDRADVLVNLKDVPCADCGNRYPTESMDFDHIPTLGLKSRNVSRIRSVGRMVDEARKCDVVCANCHRTRTKVRRKYVGKSGSGHRAQAIIRSVNSEPMAHRDAGALRWLPSDIAIIMKLRPRLVI